jgi:voltage-gated potassium channel
MICTQWYNVTAISAAGSDAMRQVEEKDRIVVNATYELFVFLLVILSIANSALELLLHSAEARQVTLVVDIGISLFLMADAMVQLIRAPHKRSYLIDANGWMVLVGSLPVPGVRLLRLLRTILLTRQLRRSDYQMIGRVVVEKRAQSALAVVAFLAIFVLEFGGIMILGAESSSPAANIQTASDALWWGYVTVATVGYGDKYPVTNAGRAVGVLMMTIGVGLFGVITGFLADWFRRPRKAAIEVQQAGAGRDDMAATVRELKRLLEAQEQAYQSSAAEIRAKLAALEATSTRPAPIEPARKT